jgi:hypothetical protein
LKALAVSPATAQLLVSLVGLYAALGLLFAVGFVWSWAGRLDPAAEHGTIGFRVAIVPGVVALWPYLLARLASGAAGPPDEWTAHRAAARRIGNPPRSPRGTAAR